METNLFSKAIDKVENKENSLALRLHRANQKVVKALKEEEDRKKEHEEWLIRTRRENRENRKNELSPKLKSGEIFKHLKPSDFYEIGDILGYNEHSSNRIAKRFIMGMCGELKNCEYDETINFGNMGMVYKVINILNSKCPNFF